tara:strand:+ start:358 stop:876 length:519 start_codon:yes stop_codon:yes gene_type:complete
MTEKKGRGRPKGSPNKPKMELVTERTNLTMNADVYEILCQANIVAEGDFKTAVNGLKIFGDRNGAVKPTLQWLFSPSINSTLPEGKTPYNPSQGGQLASDLSETSLRFEFKKFKYFVTEQVPMVRRETMWIQLLEGLPAKEAEMIDLIKDGTNPFPNIDSKLASAAFSDIQV